MLIVTDRLPTDGVAPVSVPGRQSLAVQQDVISVLAFHDDDYHVVENNSGLGCTKTVRIKANMHAAVAIRIITNDDYINNINIK